MSETRWDRLTKEELVDILDWCCDEGVVPSALGFEGDVRDAGCGCCSWPVEVPDHIQQAREKVKEP